jgi:hypothetical protein
MAQRLGSRVGHGSRHLRLDRMEDVMLGNLHAVPLWRQRQRRLLALERVLAPRKSAGDTHAEQVVIIIKAEHRRLDVAKRRMRFSGSAGH